MKKNHSGIEWTRIAAGMLAAILLAAVLAAACFVQGGYDDAGRGKMDALPGDGRVTLVDSGSTAWRYLEQGQEELAFAGALEAWRESRYDDSGWPEAAGSFGAKEGERRDVGKGKAPANLLRQYQADGSCAPVYLFRTSLTIANPESIGSMEGYIEFDDAVMIYINGELVWTGNVPDGGYENLTDYGAKEGVANPREEVFTIKDTSMLKKGENTIAVELHQDYSGSSDLYFDLISLTGLGRKEEIIQPDTSGLVLEVGKDEESVKVNWYTSEKGAFEVLYGPVVKGQEQVRERSVLMGRRKGGAQQVYCYTAGLSLQERGVEYCYRIRRIASEDVSKSYRFRAAGKENGFCFLFAGDAQIGARDIQEDSGAWRDTLEKSLTLAPDAAFLISAGDQTDSSDETKAKEQYFGFRSPAILKSLPVAVSRGNHESQNSLYEKQFKRKGNKGMEYSFVYGNVLFVVLDSMADSLEQQTEFLQQMIEDYPSEWVVVTMHYSMFSTGRHAADEGIERRRKYFAPLFSACNVDVVLSGHDHSYARSFYMNGLESTGKAQGEKADGEVLYLTGGSSTGSKYYEKAEETAGYAAFSLEKEVPVMTAVMVEGEMMTIKTYDTEAGRLVDSCVVKKQ